MNTAKKRDRTLPIGEATSNLLGRLQRRAFLLDQIAEDLARGVPTTGHEVLDACKEQFRGSMDTRDFYRLRRHAWDEVLGFRPPGSHRIAPAPGSPQAVLSAEEIFLLHERYRAISFSKEAVSFCELVSNAIADRDESSMIVDKDGRIIQTEEEGSRPEIVSFPPNALTGRHSRTFSIDGDFLTDKFGRRRAWSTRSTANEEVARIRERAKKRATPPEPLVLFPDPPQADPERAAAEGRDPVSNSYPTPLGHRPDLANERDLEKLNEWWSARYQEQKEAYPQPPMPRERAERAKIEIFIAKEDPELLARVLPGLLEAIDARAFGLRLDIENTDHDTIVVVTDLERD